MDVAEHVGREKRVCRSAGASARNVKTWSHCRYPINAGRWKALATKVLERQAYGYREGACFILKIKGAFPGSLQLNPR